MMAQALPSRIRFPHETVIRDKRISTGDERERRAPGKFGNLLSELRHANPVIGLRRKSGSGHQDAADDALYRTLADRLGVPFIPFPVRLDPHISSRDALITGLAHVDPRRDAKPTDTPIFIYAPEGEALALLMKRGAADFNRTGLRLGITTPRVFRTSLRATCGAQIAQAAANRLPQSDPHASVRMLNPAIWFIALFVLASLLITGFSITTMPWHVALLAMTGFPILPGLVIKFLALREGRKRRADAIIPPIRDWPSYTVLVPVYREAAVLPSLIKALSALDYPVSKLDIKLLIEADDVETLDALQSIRLPHHFDIVMCPRGEPRTKPRALSIGLAYAKSDYVVVYDAEDIPEPDQLKKAAAIFSNCDAQLACLQARLTIDNLDDSWLTRQFALEYAGLFDVLLPGLVELDQPVPLGGTSNHFRRAALEAVGAWDPWNVTEDADLGLRLYRAGYQVKTFASSTHEEAPAMIGAWMNQRTRWLKGWMQTACVHLRVHNGSRKTLSFARRCALAVSATIAPLSILFHPALLILADGILQWSSPAPLDPVSHGMLQLGFAVLFLASFYLDLEVAIEGARLRRIPVRIATLVGIMPYSLLKSFAAWRALIELLYAPYRWRKTQHGLARTSRLKTEEEFKTIS